MNIRSVAIFLCLAGLATGAARADTRLAGFDDLRLAEFGQRDFLASRRDLQESLAARPDPAEQSAVQLSLAALHLSRAMLPEAASFLESTDEDGLSPDMAARRRSLQAMHDLLAGGMAGELALAQTADWPDGAGLRAAAFARRGALAAAGESLEQAEASLTVTPPAVTEMLLPPLLEAAIEAGDWERARRFAARFDDHAGLREAPIYWFLLGKAAQVRGEPGSALDSYARASGGRDRAAHRARLAIVDLGLATNSLTRPEAVQLLQTARWAWRGDGVASAGLRHLAELLAQEGDTVGALGALGQLLADDPDEETRASAREAAGQILTDFYSAGAAGDLTLSQFLEGHREITPQFRFDPAYAEAALALPRTFVAAGVTIVAAEEFKALRELLTLARELDLYEVDPALPDKLRLEEAGAYLAGDRAAAAVDLLQPLLPAGGETGAEAEALMVDALARLGRDGDLTVLKSEQGSTAARRLRAAQLFDHEQWPAARTAYLGLWDTAPAAFEFVDAVRLILAAHRAGDVATVRRVTVAFDEITELPLWSEIAARLTPMEDRSEALSASDTSRRIDDAMRAVEAADLLDADLPQ